MSEVWEQNQHPSQAEVHDPIHEDEYDAAAYVGTCQWCSAYWDVRYYPHCPHCSGEIL